MPMAEAMPTATRPTLIDTRAPYTMRAQTSRPAESVPSGCSSDGGFLMASRSTVDGSEAMSGAATARIASSASTPSAAMATRSRVNRRHAVLPVRVALRLEVSVAVVGRVGDATTVAISCT